MNLFTKNRYTIHFYDRSTRVFQCNSRVKNASWQNPVGNKLEEVQPASEVYEVRVDLRCHASVEHLEGRVTVRFRVIRVETQYS